MSGFTNSNYTEAAAKSLSNLLGFGDIKAYVQQHVYLSCALEAREEHLGVMTTDKCHNSVLFHTKRYALMDFN